jgi:uncharacterized protein (DUF1800 family)
MKRLLEKKKQGQAQSRLQVQVGGRRHSTKLPPPPSAVTVGSVNLKSMSPAMVDRLFWRAGFGPTPQDRAAWTGKPVADAVEWFLATPQSYAGTEGTKDGNPLDPKADDVDLVLWWVDKMIRGQNPFVERMVFFWHRHWANSRADVSPPQLLLKQQALFRRYAELAASPDASFRTMALELTRDPSMLRFLTGEYNLKGAPNENYARELMELFGLGNFDEAGARNYSEDDVKQMAKALSGWYINESNPDDAQAAFDPNRWYNGPKSFFGKFGNFKDEDVVNNVIDHRSHANFIVRKIWHEFIASPPDAATLNDLATSYLSSGHKLKPLLTRILTHEKLFESLDEPNMVKPPVVFVVAAYRAMGAGIKDQLAYDYLASMGQVPFFPPTVFGWEGGLSWLNTNTALARFDFCGRLLQQANVPDVSGETASAAFDRAYAEVGSPWLGAETASKLKAYAAQASYKTAANRKQRQLTLRALIVAGPDGQVM